MNSTPATGLARHGHDVMSLEREKFLREHFGEPLLPFCCSLPEDFVKPSRHGRWEEVCKEMIEIRDAGRNPGPRLRPFTWLTESENFFLQIVFNYTTISRALIVGRSQIAPHELVPATDAWLGRPK